jgi:hypothetical protein
VVLQEDAVREARTKLQGLQKEKDDLEASKEDLRAKIAKVRSACVLTPILVVPALMVKCAIRQFRQC